MNLSQARQFLRRSWTAEGMRKQEKTVSYQDSLTSLLALFPWIPQGTPTLIDGLKAKSARAGRKRPERLGGVKGDDKLNPNVADLHRGKTRQSAPDVAAHSLGQVEAYFKVRKVLAEASTVPDGGLWRECSDFGRCGFATLG